MKIDTGKKIAELRKKRGLTQEQLAKEIGVSIPAVSKWETGITIPDILILCALADYFDVSTDELLGRIKFTKTAVVLSDNKAVADKITDMTNSYGIKVIDEADNSNLLLAILKDKKVDYVLIALVKQSMTEESRVELDEKIRKIQPKTQVVISDSQNEQEVVDGLEYYLKMAEK